MKKDYWMKSLIISCVVVMAYVLLVDNSALARVKNLKMITTAYPAMQVEFKKMIADYQEMHPDVRIELERVDWSESVMKIGTAHAAGSPYDIVNTSSSVTQWTLQQVGLFQPVTDVVEKIGGEKYFDPGVLVKYKGEYWMIPNYGFVFHIMYRRDLFEKKGLMPPEDWREYLNCAKELTEDTDGDGKIDRWGTIFPLGSSYFNGEYMFNLMLNNGGHILDKNGKVVFDSPKNIEAINFMKELYKYSPPGSAEYKIVDQRTVFFTGKAAMSWYSTLMLSTDVKDKTHPLYGKVGICPIPPAKRVISQF